MSARSFKRFDNVTLLRRFNFELLLRFLTPFRDYLLSRHDFQWTENFLKFPFQHLVDLLAEPDAEPACFSSTNFPRRRSPTPFGSSCSNPATRFPVTSPPGIWPFTPG